MFTIHPDKLTCYQFPDDAEQGQKDLLSLLHNPAETWFRAYGFTMVDLVDEMIAAHQAGVPLHVFLDHSQELGHIEKPLAQKLADAGVEVTVGTSYAGQKYIMHQKGFTTADGDCWEGSVNFSMSGWEQVNSAIVFNDGTWKVEFIKSFLVDRNYAWDHEPQFQIMKERPQQ